MSKVPKPAKQRAQFAVRLVLELEVDPAETARLRKGRGELAPRLESALNAVLSTERTGQPPWGKKCVWWRPAGMGYTTKIEEAGRYSYDEIRMHADPPHHVAIPCEAVEVPASAARALLKLGSPISRFDKAAQP